MDILKAIFKWVSKPTMNKLATVLACVFVVLFVASFYETAGELSYFPAAWLISSGNIVLLYLVDRVGFSKLSTIHYIQSYPEMYYKVILPLYALCILSGPIVALFLARG